MDFTLARRHLFQLKLWLDTWLPPRMCRVGCWQPASRRGWWRSATQPCQQVLDAIRQLPGCSGASSEHLIDDGPFSIDIALQLPGAPGC
jgi:hypothetical protein